MTGHNPLVSAGRAGPGADRLAGTLLGVALGDALGLPCEGMSARSIARRFGTVDRFRLHTVPFATFCILRLGGEPMLAFSEAIGAGGDTDSIAAILGGWLGAHHGANGLPHALIARIHDGPFGPAHLRELASCLGQAQDGIECPVPHYSVTVAMLRNLALYPAILAHGVRRLAPF